MPRYTLREINAESREVPQRTLRPAWPASSTRQGAQKGPRTFADAMYPWQGVSSGKIEGGPQQTRWRSA